MVKLIKTIGNIFQAKTRKVNRKLQIDNCIDLIDNQQYKLAQAYKKLTVSISDINGNLEKIRKESAKETNPELKAIKEKNIEIIESTLKRLNGNKQQIADKLQQTEDSRTLLVAKKSLLDSIESLRSMTSNSFETDDFDVNSIMDEIDKTISRIEAEFRANDELNELTKTK